MGHPGVSRRGFLTGAAGVAGAAGLSAGSAALGRRTMEQSAVDGGTVPFHGRYQAGITTPAQDRLAFAAFDLTTTSRAELRRMLVTWTRAAER